MKTIHLKKRKPKPTVNLSITIDFHHLSKKNQEFILDFYKRMNNLKTEKERTKLMIKFIEATFL